MLIAARNVRYWGVKRTWLPHRKMSANDPKRTSIALAALAIIFRNSAYPRFSSLHSYLVPSWLRFGPSCRAAKSQQPIRPGLHSQHRHLHRRVVVRCAGALGDQTNLLATSSRSTIGSRTSMPLANVTTLASDSRHVAITNPGTSRVCRAHVVGKRSSLNFFANRCHRIIPFGKSASGTLS